VIFARKINDNLTSLVKKIDDATVANRKARMGSFAVFMSDDEGLEKQLTSLADKQGLKKIVLTIDNPAGPKAYHVSKDADVTVLLYDRQTIKSNFAFRSGQLNPQAIDRILASLKKMLASD
jgi:hypothetical protein